MTLDEVRARHPDLGFALYAFDPGGEVTLEVLDGDDLFSFTGPSAEDVLARAFPEPPQPTRDISAFG